MLDPTKFWRKLVIIAYKLNVPEGLRIHPFFHVSLLKPYVRIAQTPDPIEIEDDKDAEYRDWVNSQKQENSVALSSIWLNGKVTIILTIYGYLIMHWVTQNRYYVSTKHAKSHEGKAEMIKITVVTKFCSQDYINRAECKPLH